MAQIDYGKIIRRSWEITKKYKWLWVYGLLLASAGGGGGGGSGGRSSSKPTLPENLPDDIPGKTSYVLSQTTSLISEWFSHIPISTWIVLGLGITFILILVILGTVILKSWANGALIAGVHDADEEKEVTLTTTSPAGIKAIKNLILLGIISFCITLGLVCFALITIGLGFLVFSFSEILRTIWLVLIIICAVLTLIVLVVLLTLTSIYAERLIVLHGFSPWQAWKTGLRLSRGHFLHTLLMGIINTSLGCAVGCASLLISLIVLGIPAILLVIPLVSNFKSAFTIPLIGGLVLLFLTFLYFNFLISAIFTVFKYSNWNLFFKIIMSEEKNHA